MLRSFKKFRTCTEFVSSPDILNTSRLWSREGNGNATKCFLEHNWRQAESNLPKSERLLDIGSQHVDTFSKSGWLLLQHKSYRLLNLRGLSNQSSNDLSGES